MDYVVAGDGISVMTQLYPKVNLPPLSKAEVDELAHSWGLGCCEYRELYEAKLVQLLRMEERLATHVQHETELELEVQLLRLTAQSMPPLGCN